MRPVNEPILGRLGTFTLGLVINANSETRKGLVPNAPEAKNDFPVRIISNS